MWACVIITFEHVTALFDYFMKEKEKTWLTDNPIIQLTEDNFDQITKTTDLILVDFFVNE